MGSERKIIFFDIDGTIVDNKTKRISDSTVEGIKRARDNGHLCFINTGRTGCLIEPSLTDKITFDGFLLGCGTMVVYRGKVLLHRTLTRKMSADILRFLAEHHIDAILEGSRENFYMRREEIYSDKFREYTEYYRDRNYSYFESALGKYDKLFAYAAHPSDMELFKKEYGDRLSFIDRENGYYEILPKGYSKATAIQFIVGRLNIPMECTAAIGDSNNDIPMLECVHTAIAMGNSSKSVLDIADFVTGSAAEDGIWEALKWLGVI
ncbi:MAG: HAD family hydrolase [Lachnospiraceae bacterium]|nr:HAD family hydrolase [Lachnospiraceae bacterium]